MKLREAARLDAIAKTLGRFPHVLVRRRQVGLFLAFDCAPAAALAALRAAGISARLVDIGMRGEPDLDVIVGGQSCASCSAPVHPLPAGVEIKSDNGRQRADQATYQREIAERRGILYAIAREPAEACVALGLPYPPPRGSYHD